MNLLKFLIPEKWLKALPEKKITKNYIADLIKGTPRDTIYLLIPHQITINEDTAGLSQGPNYLKCSAYKPCWFSKQSLTETSAQTSHYRMTTPTGKNYNKLRKKGSIKKKVFLVLLATALGRLCPDPACPQDNDTHETILLPHADCRNFYSCTMGFPTMLACPPGLRFNETIPVTKVFKM